MKIKDIINTYNGFKEMGDLTFTAQEGFDIGMILKELSPIVETFETERNKLIVKFGESDGAGIYTVTDDNKQKYIDEIVLLENKEIDIKLQYPKFKLKKNNTLQPKIVWAVMDFIELIE